MKNKKLLAIICIIICLVFVLIAFNGCKTKTVYNVDKTYRIISTWEKSGIKNHYYAGTAIGPLEWFAVEGLYRYVRSTDEIIPQLADGAVQHVDNLTSIIKIKQNAKWQNGDDFVADDVIAFYYLNHTTVTNYMLSITAVDSKTLRIDWNPHRVPVNSVKDLLIAQDRQGTVQYNEFKTYADTAKAIVDASPSIPDDSTTWGAFNKFSTTEQISQLNANYAAFKKHNPAWFVATGPFKLYKETATQMILVKNKLHWAADTIKFEKIEATTSSDLNQTYNLLSSNQIDYQDGLAPYDTLNAILNANPNLVHLKMFDPGSIGIVFNLENPIWTDGVREAFQYIFNREEIKNAGNPYGITNYLPTTGMAPSESKYWLKTEHYNMIKTYSYDQAKATQMLEAEGWTKTDGKWYKDGAPVKLYMGVWQDHPGQSAAAEAAQAALIDFGIDCVLKKSDSSSFFSNAMIEDSPYDMVLEWTELNMSFSYPTGSFQQFDSVYARYAHLPRYSADYKGENGETSPLANNLKLEFEYLGEGGGTIKFADKISILYSLNENELKDVVGSMVVGLSKLNYGISFYQNVTGSFLNVGMIDGVPLKDYWSQDRNVTYVPEAGTEDFYEVARTNMIFANCVLMTMGIYQPTEAK